LYSDSTPRCGIKNKARDRQLPGETPEQTTNSNNHADDA
jgi:hypothetical protein